MFFQDFLGGLTWKSDGDNCEGEKNAEPIKYREDNALRKGVKGVNKLQFSIATKGDHLIHLLQLARDDPKP